MELRDILALPGRRTFDNREAWLDARRGWVGGSDIAAIMGDNPWRKARDVVADKLGVGKPFYTSPAMWWGTHLEQANMEGFEKLSGLRCEYSQDVYVKGPIGVTLDGLIVDRGPGENPGWVDWRGDALEELPAILELKNSALTTVAKWPKGCPPKYYWWQCQAGMYVTGLTQAALVVKVGSAGMVAYGIDYDEESMLRAVEAADALMEEVRELSV